MRKTKSCFIFATTNRHFLSTFVLYRGTEQSIIYAGERSLRPDNLKEPVILLTSSRMFFLVFAFACLLDLTTDVYFWHFFLTMHYQQLSPKGGRIAPANPSPNAIIIGPSRDTMEQKVSMDAGTSISNVHPVNVYTSHEPNIQYGG